MFKLIKELAEVQATIAKANAQLAIRQAKDQVKGIIESTKDNLEKQAKQCKVDLKKFEEEYKKNSESKKGIIEEYEEALWDINSQYEEMIENILYKKCELEVDEEETIVELGQTKINLKEAKKQFSMKEKKLNSEIIKAAKSRDLSTLQAKVAELEKLIEDNPSDSLEAKNQGLEVRKAELRKEIEDCEREYERILEERENTIKALKENKDTQLNEIPKQSFLQKMIGSILDRMNKTKTFMRSAIDPLKEKIRVLKEEELPKIKEKVEKDKKEFSDNIVSKRKQIEDKVTAKVEQCALKLAEAKQNALQALSDLKNVAVGKVNDFKQDLKDKADTVKEVAGQVKDDITARKDAIVQGAQVIKDSVVTHVTNGVLSVKNTFRNIVDKGYESKINFINRLQNKLDKKKDELALKREILNKDNNDNNDEQEVEV